VSTWARRVRLLGGACISGAVLVATVAPSARAAVTPTAAVSLNGGSAWAVHEEDVPWANDLFGAKSPIDLNITYH